MTPKRRAVLVVCLLFIARAGGTDRRVLVAQTSSVPAFAVVRNPSLRQQLWPGDFNGDGKIDVAASVPLAGTDSALRTVIALGRGDGTFAAPLASSFLGIPRAVADINNDGKLDIIGGPEIGGTLAVLPGNGDGTLGDARRIGHDMLVTFVQVADFDNDGFQDVVVGTSGAFMETDLQLFPGHGDFTFGAPVQLVFSAFAAGGVAADFNGDGRPDIVVTNPLNNTLSIFMNQGALMFAARDVPLDRPPTDATSADVNGDGRLDLIVTTASSRIADGGFVVYTDGYANVMIGRGDGTFAEPIPYAVAPGAFRILAGDFTRDGVIDIATASQSATMIDDCQSGFRPYRTWDSLSILPGHGDGTFGMASSFSIGDQWDLESRDYRDSVTSLTTADLNGDGALDLLTSEGALFLNRPFSANRKPAVNADVDRALLNTTQVTLHARVYDPDDDVVSYQWSSDRGLSVAPVPNPCVTGLQPGANTFTVTVDDGHGHRVSDSVTYTVGNSDGSAGSFAARNDIGHALPAGSDSFDGTTYTVSGGGTDIWNNADGFHYVWTETGASDFNIVARVASVEDVSSWTKAGIMIRENLNAGARHVSLFATPGNGLAFVWRSAESGASASLHGPAQTEPVWLRLSRHGDLISAYYRKNPADLWVKVGAQTVPGLVSEALVGLAVSSHAQGTLATATFTDVKVGTQPEWTGLPLGAGAAGSVTSWDGTVMTVDGRGADIWNSIDSFYFVNSSWDGDLTMTVRVRSIANTHVWAKTGLMIRDTFSLGARHVMVVVTPASGVSMQYRSVAGQSSTSITSAGVAPEWLRLVRRGDTFTAFTSEDSVTWRTLGSVTVAMNHHALIGMPVSSHNLAATTTASFEGIMLEP
jgi:regulation of enolase protein 1 (concanavalin A-like superfamily)